MKIIISISRFVAPPLTSVEGIRPLADAIRDFRHITERHEADVVLGARIVAIASTPYVTTYYLHGGAAPEPQSLCCF